MEVTENVALLQLCTFDPEKKFCVHPMHNLFPSDFIYPIPHFPSTIFNNVASFWPFNSNTLSVNVSSRCWAWAMMLTTLGKLRAAWRIFFLCPGSVIPMSRRSWSSITLLPCMWTNVRDASKKTRARTHECKVSHSHMAVHARKVVLMRRQHTSCRRNTERWTCTLKQEAEWKEKLWVIISAMKCNTDQWQTQRRSGERSWLCRAWLC